VEACGGGVDPIERYEVPEAKAWRQVGNRDLEIADPGILAEPGAGSARGNDRSNRHGEASAVVPKRQGVEETGRDIGERDGRMVGQNQPATDRLEPELVSRREAFEPLRRGLDPQVARRPVAGGEATALPGDDPEGLARSVEDTVPDRREEMEGAGLSGPGCRILGARAGQEMVTDPSVCDVASVHEGVDAARARKHERATETIVRGQLRMESRRRDAPGNEGGH
jgi:hypothetical protein